MPTALRRLLDQRAQPLPAVLRNSILAISAVAVVAGSIWAWSSTGLAVDDINWLPIGVAFAIAAPASLVLKAFEFRISAQIAGQNPGRRRSLNVAVVSSAANLLPLPGSLLVTVRSLSEDGSTYGRAIAASAVPGLAWLGITGIVGGIAIGIEGALWLAVLTIACGMAAGIAATTLFASTAPADGRVKLGASIIAVEAGWLAVSAVRLGLAVTALGVSIDPTQAVALSVAGALTVAIGFFPGGLGVREALIAALAPLIGLPFDTGVLLGSLDRVVWLAFLALAAGVLALRRDG
ncbi:MAG: hypothetical protein ACI9MX_003280 [Candidatus Aldehydirespiratoraceae bacterium]|jgi:hypothetical protein